MRGGAILGQCRAAPAGLNENIWIVDQFLVHYPDRPGEAGAEEAELFGFAIPVQWKRNLHILWKMRS